MRETGVGASARTTVLLAVIAGVVAATVFTPALGGSWIYDDHPLIEQNPYVHSWRWFTRWFTTDFWNVNEEVVSFGQRMIYWRPGVTASYALDWQLGGGSPVVFHLMNTLYHGLVAALAFLVLRRWVNAAIAAFAAAVVFAIHPTKAESVAWIAGRTDVLCMLAILIATIGIGRRLRDQRWGVPLEVVGTIGAYLTKEQAIVLPAFAMVEGWIAAGRPAVDFTLARRLVRVVAPQTIIAISYLVLRALLMPIASANPGGGLSIRDHSLAVLETFGRFVTLTFAPHDLSIQHGLLHFADGQMVHSMPYVVIGAVAVPALLVTAFVLRRRWPVATVGIAFYLITLLPTANLKYTQMMTLVSERFLYLPTFGIALLIGAALARANREWATRAYALIAACAVALGTLALSRAADFADEERFWARESSLHPDSREALFYRLRVAHQEKRFQSSLEILLHIKTVLDRHDRISPDDVRLTYKVAEMVARLTPDRDTAGLKAIDAFCSAMLDPEVPTAELAVGKVRLAIGPKTRGYELKLRNVRPYLLALRADIHSRLGEDAVALDLASSARSLCSTCATVFAVDAITFARAGNYEQALAVVSRVEGALESTSVAGIRAILEKARAAHAEAMRSNGPAQLRARALELSTLEAWGRAYEVLSPYKEEIKRAPAFAEGFAELAFRAGYSDVAREVLISVGRGSDIESTLDEWAIRMGWSE